MTYPMRYILLILMILMIAGCTDNASVGQINELQEQINDLRSETDDLNSQIETLETAVEERTREIADLQAQNTRLQGLIIEAAYPIEPEIVISIEKGEDSITFNAEITGEVYFPVSNYQFPIYPWEIYKKENDEWKLVPFRACLGSCDSVCDIGPSGCTHGVPSQICESADANEELIWDMKHSAIKSKDCGLETHECSYFKTADEGDYKVRFLYSQDCREGELFRNYDEEFVEQEFTI